MQLCWFKGYLKNGACETLLFFFLEERKHKFWNVYSAVFPHFSVEKLDWSPEAQAAYAHFQSLARFHLELPTDKLRHLQSVSLLQHRFKRYFLSQRHNLHFFQS